MALKSICLRGFRNLEPTIVGFAEGSNYLFGPNGAGKTNLLEAIHYLAIGRSFRRCPDTDMLGFDKDVLAVSGTDESGDTAEIRFDGREKRILRNDIPVEKLSEYFGWLPVVVLLLEDIELVRGAPGIRRNFLDVAIAKAGPSRADSYHKGTKIQSEGQAHCQTGAAEAKLEARSQRLDVRSEEEEQADERAKSEARGQKLECRTRAEERSYIALTSEYRRAVSQYNRLLERSGASREPVADQLSAWEEELVLSGVPVYEARLAKVGELLTNAAKHYERLAGHGVVFSYRSSVGDTADIANAFRQRLAATRERARALGHALVGPHRDDIRITRGDRELRKFGSVGEQRLAGIALRLAEADMILSAGRQRPVFLLDEVASELDEQRSRMVLEMVAERGQMVYAAARRMRPEISPQRHQDTKGSDESSITAADRGSDFVPLCLGGKDWSEFHVEAGKVSEVS